jgi:hypothetical protein
MVDIALVASGAFFLNQFYRFSSTTWNSPSTVLTTARNDIGNDLAVGQVANNAMALQARDAANPAILQTCVTTHLNSAVRGNLVSFISNSSCNINRSISSCFKSSS